MTKTSPVLTLNHDINNHLGIVRGYFELLLKKHPELKTEKYSEHVIQGLNRCVDLSANVAGVCDKLLDSNSYVSKDSRSGLKLISVQEHIFKNAKPAIEKLMEVYDIDIGLKLTVIEEEKYAYLNPAELVRVRENIVSNAIAAGATQLNIHFEMKDYGLIVTFEDNGNGMSQEDIDRTLLCVHGDGKRHGLGTKIIKEGADRLGAYISYTSVIGKGTTIRGLVPYTT